MKPKKPGKYFGTCVGMGITFGAAIGTRLDAKAKKNGGVTP